MNDAMQKQVGGSHYKGMKIEPFEFGHANRYDPEAFSVMKYVSRHRSKGGVEDLKKALHIADIRVAMIQKWGPTPAAENIITASDFITANNIPEPDAKTLRWLHFMACFGGADPDSLVSDSETLKTMIGQIIQTYEKEPQ